MKSWTDAVVLVFPALLTFFAIGFWFSAAVAGIMAIAFALTEAKQRSEASRDAFLMSLSRNTDAFLAAQTKKQTTDAWALQTRYPSHTRIMVKR